MDEKLKKELVERFATLPKDVQNVILSSDYPKKIEGIAEKYALSEEQNTDLSNEVMFVMIGLERPTAFVENVRKTLGLPSETANKIVAEVNETIFKLIRESLKQIHPADHEEPLETILNRRTFTMPPAPPPPLSRSSSISIPALERKIPRPPSPTSPISPVSAIPSGAPNIPQKVATIPPRPPVNLPTGQGSPFVKPPERPAPLKNVSQPMTVKPQGLGGVMSGTTNPPTAVTEKLTVPTALPREDKKYSADPYREPVQ